MLISELAQRAGVPIHTLRFYEREGLIDERFFKRGENGYRYYAPEAVERIAMIRHGQSAGYSIAEVRHLLAAWDSGELTSAAQVVYLEDKLTEITDRIAELEQIKSYLSAKLERMRLTIIREEAAYPASRPR
jgi:MerR family transcriptional regulator, copper efflux regulator